jgi:hypothetical protein
MKRFAAYFFVSVVFRLCTLQEICARNLTSNQPSHDSTVTLTPLVLTGQAGVSYGYNSLAAQGAFFAHFGGPGLTWKYGDWSLSLNVSPSLRGQFGDVVRPTMGFGPTLGYKRWLLVAPIYFDAINGKTTYIPTIGVGYRF